MKDRIFIKNLFVGSPVSTANLERLKAKFEEDHKHSDDLTHRSNMSKHVFSYFFFRYYKMCLCV